MWGKEDPIWEWQESKWSVSHSPCASYRTQYFQVTAHQSSRSSSETETEVLLSVTYEERLMKQANWLTRGQLSKHRQGGWSPPEARALKLMQSSSKWSNRLFSTARAAFSHSPAFQPARGETHTPHSLLLHSSPPDLPPSIPPLPLPCAPEGCFLQVPSDTQGFSAPFSSARTNTTHRQSLEVGILGIRHD